MTYSADLHVHSSYAYATSRELNFENLARWARIKGVDLLASADFTHPIWFSESKAKLVERGDGLYEHGGVKFALGSELSCVARVGGRARRVHVLAFAPSLDTVAKIIRALEARGAKLNGDGRPTLRMSPRDMLAMLLDADPRCFVIPAHVWTPWYGVFGSKSGFDSLEECFGDLTAHVAAVETGLSADPSMCWRVPNLDDMAIVSFSDAHSLPKLARELTVFEGEPSYGGLVEALRSQHIAYTVEMFPEEGKYHNSGHRRCGVSLAPEDVARDGSACPVCGKGLTLGVTQRVGELAQRDAVGRVETPDGGRPPYRSLVSLRQALSEVMGVGVGAKRVTSAYMRLVESLGSELYILLNAPLADVARALPVHGERLAEGVGRIRCGDVHVVPGFDGKYGTVRVWPEDCSRKRAQPLLI